MLNSAGIEFTDPEQLLPASDDLIARTPEQIHMPVDGTAMPFRMLRESGAWAAVAEHERDHLISASRNR